jgi:hypothetical protein
MSEQLQLRRGTAAQVAAFTGAQGELAVDTTNNRLVVNDGATAGGWPLALATRTAVSDAAWAAVVTDRLVAYTALTAARIVTLPAAASYPAGAVLTVIDESGACSPTLTITVSRAGSDTISGALSATIASAYGSLKLESNGVNAWTVIDANNPAVNRGAPCAIGQSHIPFVLVSSGTMGNDGALSGFTAVAAAYPNAYVYLPAGAIASGSAAGWYYAVFSSTTAATVYNNAYSSGTPAIPASPTAFVTTGPGAFTQTTGSLITAYALTIPGNTIGPNGSIRVTGAISYDNDGNSKTLGLSYGGTSLGLSSQTTSLNQGLLGGFSNRGATNVQGPLTGRNLTTGTTTSAFLYGAVDSTVSQTLALSLELNTAATDTITLESIVVELIPGV